MWDVVWVTLLRILAALGALVVPLPAMWLSGHIDRWDWSLLGMPAGEHQQLAYQYWDKSLDTITLAIVLVVALQWKDSLARRIAIVAFAWRAVGVVAFLATGERAVFILFPSVLEKFFFFYLVFRVLARQDIMFRTRADVAITMLALTLPKVLDEYFMHVGGRPWQTSTLLPAPISTPDGEYWLWMSIMLALPAVSMVRLLLQQRETTGASVPLLTALLGRQVHANTEGSFHPGVIVGGRAYGMAANAIKLRASRLMGNQGKPAILQGPRPTMSELLIETLRQVAPHSS